MSYFIIRNVPENTHIETKKRYFVAYFPGKKADNNVFKYNFKDNMFSGFFVENIDNGSRIIIKTKKPYEPEFTKNKGTLIIKAVFRHKIEKQNKNIYEKIPDSLIATPFYISSMVFGKNGKNKESSYDESLFFTGVKFFANKNYAYAMQFFKEIVDKYPNSSFYVSSYFLLGDCYRNMKQYKNALNIYKKAVTLSPKNDTVAQTLFSMADIYKKIRFYSQARGIYKSIIRDYATTKWADMARYMTAKLYYSEKRYDKALNILLNIDENSSYYSLSMLLAAEIFIKENNDAKAVLAYYSMSNRLNGIDIEKYYKELIDVAEALCRFNDYNGADDIFKYIGSFNSKDIFESVYIGQMRCDLNKGNYDDLKEKGEYIIKNSKNKARIREAKKLLDEAKLQKGNVNIDTINNILNKYAKDPEIASLALYIYAKKNYRENNYKNTIKYLLKLKRIYPKSIYNKKAIPIASKSINKMLDDFYQYPNTEKLDYIYKAVIELGNYKAEMCRLALALTVEGRIDKMHVILPHIEDKNCKGVLYAKYYIEKGEYKKALEYAGNIEGEAPYVYYVNIVVGDVNYFKGSYGKAIEFYKQALGVKDELIREYIYLKIANALYLDKNYKDSIKYLKNITMKIYEGRANYVKAMDLYLMGKYKDAIKIFKILSNNLNYQEKALFYTAVSYIKAGSKKEAEQYFKKLKNSYPNSEYIKALKVLMP